MSRINLRNLLSPRSDAYASLSLLVKELNASIFVEDAAQKLVFGNAGVAVAKEEPLRLDDETIGFVKGDEKTGTIASIINLFIQKEAEKKKLGNEVLMLYQEVNLIFNFSDKLAQTIGQNNIADITLDEAARLIKSEHGLFIMWSEETQSMEVLSYRGEPVFNEEKIKSSVELLQAISRSGQSEIMGDLTGLKDAGVIVPDVQSLIYASLKVKHRVLGAIILARKDANQYAAADLKFLITLALQSSSAIESALLYEKNIREAKEREDAMRQVYEVTNKFVPHEFIRSLGRHLITDIQLGDKVEKIVTVLFSDIRDYTTLAEQMTPEETFGFVCSFNERIGPIIRKHNGFINQYLGDAIMAIFPGNAADALGAAIGMQKAVQELNATRAVIHKPPIRIGVGMHTGPLIMGITGDHERLDAATISDTVNTASRLESLTKYYKVNILLSEASLRDIQNADDFHFRQLGLIQLKGRNAPTNIYECFNGNDGKAFTRKLNALPYYQQGMSDYFQKAFKEASAKFHLALELDPDDPTTRLFLGRSNQYLDSGIPENWTGVEEMSSK